MRGHLYRGDRYVIGSASSFSFRIDIVIDGGGRKWSLEEESGLVSVINWSGQGVNFEFGD